jgi:radical SAM protein with 4Fe4S-binding SPASM domain
VSLPSVANFTSDDVSALGARVQTGTRHGQTVLTDCETGRTLPYGEGQRPLVTAMLQGRRDYEPTFDEIAYLQLARFYLFDEGRLSPCLDYTQLVPSLALALRPREVSFVVTKLCNLQCLHCYNDSGHRHPNELPPAQKVALVEFLGRWGVNWLTLTGGEPTLDPAFDDLLMIAGRYRMAVKVSTNGWRLPDRLLEAIDGRVVAQINISLDGSDAATHDWFRQHEGSYARVMRSLEALRSTSLRRLVFNVSIHRGSLAQMETLTRVAIENRATAVSFKPVVSTGRRGMTDDFTLSDAQVASFKTERDRLRCVYGNDVEIDGKLLAEEINPSLLELVACGAGESAMFIDADGRMLPCESVSYLKHAANVRTITPMHAWLEDPAFTWFRDLRSRVATSCGGSACCGSTGCPGNQGKQHLPSSELIQLRV